MASTWTALKHIEKPGHGDYTNTWDVPVNADWDVLDSCFAGISDVSVTGVPGATQTFSTGQYQTPVIVFQGTLSNDVVYQFPTGITGYWIIANTVTPAGHTVTVKSQGGGSTYVVPTSGRVLVFCDATNVLLANTITSPYGSDTQVQYNDGGSMAGSANLTFNKATNTLAVTKVSTSSVIGTTYAMEFVIDGGGSVITTGMKGYLQAVDAGTVTQWTIVGDTAGSISVDITSDPYSSFGSNTSLVGVGTKPNIAAATKGQAAPSGWTGTAITAGNFIGFSVSSVATVTKVTVILTITRT